MLTPIITLLPSPSSNTKNKKSNQLLSNKNLRKIPIVTSELLTLCPTYKMFPWNLQIICSLIGQNPKIVHSSSETKLLMWPLAHQLTHWSPQVQVELINKRHPRGIKLQNWFLFKIFILKWLLMDLHHRRIAYSKLLKLFILRDNTKMIHYRPWYTSTLICSSKFTKTTWQRLFKGKLYILKDKWS